jgi:hypothetical protein
MQIVGLIPLVIKLIAGSVLILLLVLIVVLTNSEAIRKKLHGLAVAILQSTGTPADLRTATTIGKLTSVLGSLSIPLVMLTTLLSIPPHGMGILQSTHDFVEGNFWLLLVATETVTIWVIYNSKDFNNLILTVLKITVKVLIALFLGAFALAAFSADVVTASPGQSTSDLARSFSKAGMNVAVMPYGGNVDLYRGLLRLTGTMSTVLAAAFFGWAGSNIVDLEYEFSSYEPRAAKSAGRRILSGCVVGLVACALALLVAYYTMPQIRESFNPATRITLFDSSESYGWPAPLIVEVLVLGVPALIAGMVVAGFSAGPISLVGGLFGIMMGIWWEIHLDRLGAFIGNAGGGRVASFKFLKQGVIGDIENIEFYLMIHGGTIFGIVTLLLPVIVACVMLRISLTAETIARFFLRSASS